MLDERKLDVLRAVVEDFVSTGEAVGSKALAERHPLGVSPATVRNDMATLEDDGYITHPHTSAGRIPTDKGYRLFVDRLSEIKPLTAAERRAIGAFLEGAIDLDDVVRRTVRLLAQLTRHVAVVQYPSLARSSVRHVEVVPVAATRLLLVAILDTGRVEQRVVETAIAVGEDTAHDLRTLVNARIAGRLLSEIPDLLATLPDAATAELRGPMLAVVSALLESLVEQPEERVMLAGTANLSDSALDFGHSIRPVLEALEEHVVLLRLLGEATDPSQVTVSIGGENQIERLHTVSVVSSGYGSAGHPLAALGVLGPTRMDYPGAMGAVRAVARYVGQILAEA
jgi:heat-inducible transcriptional repressor